MRTYHSRQGIAVYERRQLVDSKDGEMLERSIRHAWKACGSSAAVAPMSPLRSGRVEAKRGGVKARRRRQRATSYVVALAEKAIAAFLRPRSSNRTWTISVIRLSDEFHATACAAAGARTSAATRHPQFPNDHRHGKPQMARPGNLVPARRRKRRRQGAELAIASGQECRGDRTRSRRSEVRRWTRP